jgi:hypothetical protein
MIHASRLKLRRAKTKVIPQKVFVHDSPLVNIGQPSEGICLVKQTFENTTLVNRHELLFG